MGGSKLLHDKFAWLRIINVTIINKFVKRYYRYFNHNLAPKINIYQDSIILKVNNLPRHSVNYADKRWPFFSAEGQDCVKHHRGQILLGQDVKIDILVMMTRTFCAAASAADVLTWHVTLHVTRDTAPHFKSLPADRKLTAWWACGQLMGLASMVLQFTRELQFKTLTRWRSSIKRC